MLGRKELLSQIFQENGRMHIIIQQILQSLSPQNDVLNLIRLHTNSPCSPIKGLKILIFLHNLLLAKAENLQTKHLLDLLKSINCSQVDAFQKFIVENLVNQYKLYLERKVHPSIDRKIGHDPQLMDQFFYKLNLIKRSVSFCDIFITFGRYYRKTYPFIIDLNIVVGRGIQKQYAGLAKLFFKIKLQLTQEIIDEIEKLHEKMEIVFYNCYYYQYMSDFIPKLIRIQKYSVKEQKSQNASDSNDKRELLNSKQKLFEEKIDLSSFPENEQFTRRDLIQQLEKISKQFE